MKNYREYGKAPYRAVVVHGGPGAAGEMAPVAKELSRTFGVLEPLQTKSTIEGQARELKRALEKNAEPPVILAGYSWGAWLSCILAAKYPKLVKKLILVSSGPFEGKYARGVMGTRLARLTKKERAAAIRLYDELKNAGHKAKDNVLKEFGRLMRKADTFSRASRAGANVRLNAKIFKKVWEQAEALRNSGKLLALAGRIKCPVTAIHGDYDTHPAEGVNEPLSRTIKDFKFVLIKDCGHSPWMERFARDEFFGILKKEIRY